MKLQEYADPRKYLPMQFSVDVQIDAANGALGLMPGDTGRGQVAINDRPFLLAWITHQIVWAADLPDNLWQAQDGMYRIDWSEYEQIRFFKGSIPLADIAFGSVRTGIWIPFPAPVPLPGNQTLHVAISNALARGADWDRLTVQVIFHGFQERKQPLEDKTSPNLES